MALSTGVIVANIYYAQPLLAAIARDFGLTVTQAGLIAMLSQAGTSLGMFLFVPLGDKFERRSLIVLLLGGCCVAMAMAAAAPTAVLLGVASFAVGATAATVHVIVPLAAHLAAPNQRGRVVGTVLSGLLMGVLLARTFSGTMGALFGWRSVYATGAVAMILLAVVVRALLPESRPEVKIAWPALMRSCLDLAVRHAALRESALLGALLFCAFSAFWTTLVFFLHAAYGYGSAVAGLFGLVGAAGAAGAPLIGHLADRYGPRRTILFSSWLALGSFVIMGLWGGRLAGLILGVLLMDLGVQSGHVSNQARIYGIDPGARSRLNMVYMVTYFIGGATGSYLGAVCWRWAGWGGVCGFGAATLCAALCVQAICGRRARRAGHE